jgi:acyl-CoA synthetase (AMP-forming)/AMP-acid ligase II
LLAPGLDALSFKDLETAIVQLAAQLAQAGVGPQDRVAVICSPGVATGVVCLGVIAAAVCVPLNPDYQAEEYRYFFREIGVGRVVLTAEPESPASRVADELSIPVTRIHVAAEGGGKLLSVVGSPESTTSSFKLGDIARDADTALVLHTSGSTAAPKLLALSHEQVVKSARNIAGTLKLSATDRCLNMMPLFHVGGLIDLLLVPLSVGGSVVLSGPLPAKQFYETLAHHQPTWFQGVPTMLSDIRDHALARRSRFSRCFLAARVEILFSAARRWTVERRSERTRTLRMWEIPRT